jgi:hypothetical protein
VIKTIAMMIKIHAKNKNTNKMGMPKINNSWLNNEMMG